MNEPTNLNPIRVLIVDDSAVIRGIVTRAIAEIPEALVVGSVSDGQAAINLVKRDLVDIIFLDVEMPIKDGLSAIPELVEHAPWARIVMSSMFTQSGAEVSLKALELGAADYVSKPTSTRDTSATDEWKRELLEKLRILGMTGWRERHKRGNADNLPPILLEKQKKEQSAVLAVAERRALKSAAQVAATPAAQADAKSRLYEGIDVKLRESKAGVPDIILIGSSTGGPQALFKVLPHLKGLRQPVLITQHMPKAFTTILADHITRQTGLPCHEAVDGEVIQGGVAIVAPGDFHMLCEKQGAQIKVKLDQGAPENFCRPAVDPMIRSVMAAYGANKILIAILTGMGSDGTKGGELLVAGGGTMISQDQATSVVWGMPGSVATAGFCTAVLPIDEIGPWLRRRAVGTAS